MIEAATQQQIDSKARYFYLSCAALFGLRFYSSALFSQMSQPVLIDPGIDNTYWLFHWLGIPAFATRGIWWPAILDMLLFFLPIIASAISRRQLYALAFTLLVLVYQISYSSYAQHHYHSLVGMLFLGIPFWFGPGKRFTILWEATRYYFFFIFASASLWKLFSGAPFHSGQMQAILMAQHAQAIYDHPQAWSSILRSWLIAHNTVAQALLIGGWLIQLSFFGGFLTRRWDRTYIFLFLAFFVTNYFLMNILSVELFIMLPVLFQWHDTKTRPA